LGGLTAQACSAGVVVPAQAEVIHPPDFRSGSDSDIDTNRVKVLERVVKGNTGKCTVVESGTGRDSDALGGNCSGVASAWVISETSEMEVTVRAPRIAAERCTIHVEAKAAGETVITIADITRVAIFDSVGSSHCVRAVDIEVRNELHKERLGRWQIWSSRWGNDDKSIRKVELMIWVEDRFWLNVVWIFVADA
jgi:hypothetical protein